MSKSKQPKVLYTDPYGIPYRFSKDKYIEISDAAKAKKQHEYREKGKKEYYSLNHMYEEIEEK